MRTESQINTNCYLLHVKGLVQGVGFRPFIFRLAKNMDLKGHVENRNDGVYIHIRASETQIKEFENNIRNEAPPASSIQSIAVKKTQTTLYSDFQIIKSTNISSAITQVSPDICVCKDCLEDMEHQQQRVAYPFTNCTNCGPRYSIIKELPYDRPLTTMASFAMCPACSIEYNNVLDRRFHAQPIACKQCGPQYKLHLTNSLIHSIDEITEIIAHEVAKGKVFALKGMGGFHLMCDATNENAVAQIREIKNRDGKPFAVMASSISAIKTLGNISPEEQHMLESWQRPIVLIKYNKGLAKSVTNSLNRLGVFLPYMPFHFQLFKKLHTSFIVLTSGNLSDEPIIIDNEIALTVFKDKVAGVLSYNREIYNRVDDSVCCIANSKEQIIRRSRGYAPKPIITAYNTEGIFAAGAELANSFCIGKGNQAIMSPYIGDLKNMETLEFYEETYQRFEKLFRFKPELVCFDVHPNYLSAQFAKNLAEKYKVPFVQVQHHHAHIASVMATHNLDCSVIGISFDGLGLGSDGKLWGAEFFEANLNDFNRLYHFNYIPMPGGDKASKEPWRMALSYLVTVFGAQNLPFDLPVFKAVDEFKITSILQLIKKNINSPQASSAGRLFDAVASIIGLSHFNSFQAEAPMRLESIINYCEKGCYAFEIKEDTILFDKMIRQLVGDYQNKLPAGNISTKFHNTLIEIMVTVCQSISNHTSLKKVVLSGGTFQNIYLTENIETRLKALGFEVFLPKQVPVNDQGIALGQLAIAAKRRHLGNVTHTS